MNPLPNAGLTLAQSLNAIRINPAGSLTQGAAPAVGVTKIAEEALRNITEGRPIDRVMRAMAEAFGIGHRLPGRGRGR